MTREELIESLQEIIDGNNELLTKEATDKLAASERLLEYNKIELEEKLDEKGIVYESSMAKRNESVIAFTNSFLESENILLIQHNLTKSKVEESLAYTQREIDAANSLLSERQRDIENFEYTLSKLSADQDSNQIELLERRLSSARADIIELSDELDLFKFLKQQQKDSLVDIENQIFRSERSMDEVTKMLEKKLEKKIVGVNEEAVTYDEEELNRTKSLISSASAAQAYLGYNLSSELTNILVGLKSEKMSIDEAKIKLNQLDNEISSRLLFDGNDAKQQQKQIKSLRKEIKSELDEIESKLDNVENYHIKKDESSIRAEILAIENKIKQNQATISIYENEYKETNESINENKEKSDELSKQKQELIEALAKVSPNGRKKSALDTNKVKKSLNEQISRLSQEYDSLKEDGDRYKSLISETESINKKLESKKSALEKSLEAKPKLDIGAKTKDEEKRSELEASLLILDAHEKCLMENKESKFNKLITKMNKENKGPVVFLTDVFDSIKCKFKELNPNLKKEMHTEAHKKQAKAGLSAIIIGASLLGSSIVGGVIGYNVGRITTEKAAEKNRQTIESEAKFKHNVKGLNDYQKLVHDSVFGKSIDKDRDIEEKSEPEIVTPVTPPTKKETVPEVVIPVAPPTKEETTPEVVAPVAPPTKEDDSQLPEIDLPAYGEKDNSNTPDNNNNSNNGNNNGGSNGGSNNGGGDYTPDPTPTEKTVVVETPNESITFNEIGNTTVRTDNTTSELLKNAANNYEKAMQEAGKNVVTQNESDYLKDAQYNADGSITSTYENEKNTVDTKTPIEIIREYDGFNNSDGTINQPLQDQDYANYIEYLKELGEEPYTPDEGSMTR